MKFIITSIVVLFLLFIFVRFIEYKSLYYPFRGIEYTPSDIGLDYEDISLTTKDGVQIAGWFIPAVSPRATFLFAHGNGGNISHRLDKIKMFNDLNVNTLIFDYRGYGMSEGNPSEKGFYLDAEASYEYLLDKKKVPKMQIIGYGESMGGAVIIDLASRYDLDGLIIESSFTSVGDMGKKMFPFIPAFIYKTKYDSLSKIKDISSPKLIFHSPGDEIVPFVLGKKLFEAAMPPKKFIELQGGHNDAFLVSEKLFTKEIDSFLQ